MKDNVWKFLMKLFATTCHQKSNRSFFLGNYQFPVCQRCTGLFIGYILGSIYVIFKGKISIFLSLLFLFIMFLDWFIQYKNIKESNKFRRLITGVLSGFGVIGLIVNCLMFIKTLL